MKTEKMSFKNIKDVLSREEMKEIMAGSGSVGGGCPVNCTNMTATQVMDCVSACYSGGVLNCGCYACCSAYYCGGQCT